MKIVLFVFVVSVLTFGCKKEDPAAEMPGPAIPVDTVTRVKPPEPPGDSLIPPHARRGVTAAPDRNLLRDHATAARHYLTLPDSAMPVPIPPGALRPFKNLKLVKNDGRSVFYTFETADGKPGDMFLVKHGIGTDTIWIPLHILPKL